MNDQNAHDFATWASKLTKHQQLGISSEHPIVVESPHLVVFPVLVRIDDTDLARIHEAAGKVHGNIQFERYSRTSR